MSILRHQLLDDGRVLIVCVNGSTHSIHVSLTEAKRFAWSLLNDVDPDGVFEHKEAERRPAKKKHVTQAVQILRLLNKGDMSTVDVGLSLGVSRNQAAVVLHRLKELDLARVVAVGGYQFVELGRVSNTWGITEVGSKYLADYENNALARAALSTPKHKSCAPAVSEQSQIAMPGVS